MAAVERMDTRWRYVLTREDGAFRVVINVSLGVHAPQSEKYSNRKDLVLKISQQPNEANTTVAGTFSCWN